MANTHRSCINPNPSLLLVEPATPGHSERAAQLDQANFLVTRASNPRDIYLMRTAFSFSIAVLSASVGFLVLRASAETVRAQWPEARILILGEPPSQFDDHLYDDTVAHATDGNTLLKVLAKLAEDPWDQRSPELARWLDLVSAAPRALPRWPIAESDPTKQAAPILMNDLKQDRPARQQSRQAAC